MTSESQFAKRTLQGALYSGIALVIISILFTFRGIATDSLLGQWVLILVVPAIFYGIGLLIYRYLDAPLAAPGVVATGAWLVAVGLIQLYDRQSLVPPNTQAVYWLGVSTVAAALISVTGHRIRIWIMAPLVPLVQLNALWALFSLLNVSVLWVPILSLVLVAVWWEAPGAWGRWRTTYRVSGLVLGLLMLALVTALPFSNRQFMFITWGAAAILSAGLGLRHRLPHFILLVIGLLSGACLFGLTTDVLAVTMLGLSVGSIWFVHTWVRRAEKGKDVLLAQAIFASGIAIGALAALIAELLFIQQISAVPANPLFLHLAAAALFLWIGIHHQLNAAVHAGLWLMVAAWAHLYYAFELRPDAYGLWLAMFAVVVLLAQRILTSRQKGKQKSSRAIVETLVQWPGADLAIVLSAVVLGWTAVHIGEYTPALMLVTFSVVIGIWVVASLLYRIPALLHVSLWVAPIPFALLLMLVSPVFYALPVIGIAWQFLAILMLIVGHFTPRYRPVMRVPFFTAGYPLLVFGFLTAIQNPALFPASLTILIVACILTAAAAILGQHPIWTLMVDRLIPPERHPYANRYIEHAFLFLAAWMAVVWLQLVLAYTGLTWPQQGLALVLFSCLWFLLGVAVGRLPGAVGLPLLSAGWALWIMGLTEVFFAPTEALIVVVFGLIAGVEALRRTRRLVWIPLLMMQVLFTSLQIAWLLRLPVPPTLLITATCATTVGLLYQLRAKRGGQLAAAIGLAVIVVLWKLYPTLEIPLALLLLSLIATLVERRPRMVWIIQVLLLLFLMDHPTAVLPLVNRDFSLASAQAAILLILGVSELVIGMELVARRTATRYRPLSTFLLYTDAWATPFLMCGMSYLIASLMSFWYPYPDYQMATPHLLACLGIAAGFTYYGVRLRIFGLPYAVIALIGLGLSYAVFYRISPETASSLSTANRGAQAIQLNTVVNSGAGAFALIVIALALRAVCLGVIGRQLKVPRFLYTFVILWLRPIAAMSLAALSVGGCLLVSTQAHTSVFSSFTALGIAMFMVSCYRRQPKHFGWLAIGLGAASFGWTMALRVADLISPAAILIPVGVLLFCTAACIRHPLRRLFDEVAIVLMVGGALQSLRLADVFSTGSLGYFGYAGILLCCGALLRRRQPFFAGLILVGVASLLYIAHINPWLIPLGAGLFLIGGALIMETRSALARGALKQAAQYVEHLS